MYVCVLRDYFTGFILINILVKEIRMPREQVQWFMKESVHDSEKIHAQQSCTYYSIVNVNKANYPFSSSYEQEQTWTLRRTISNNHKRYQSSIENIHLTVPTPTVKTKPVEYENIKVDKIRSNSLVSSSQLAQKYISSTSLHPTSAKNNPAPHQEQKSQDRLERQNDDSDMKKSRPFSKPMRVIHSNGEFVVRI